MALLGKKTDPTAVKEQWDQALIPLFKLMTGKKGFKTKQAAEVGKKKVTYFRGKDCTWFTEHQDLLKRKCGKALAEYLGDKEKPIEGPKEFERLITALTVRGFIYPTKYSPLQGDKEAKPRKWPDRLTAVPPNSGSPWDESYFYVLAYEGDKSMQYVMLGAVMVAFLLACMFPAWPMWAKLGVWYAATALLCLMLFIVVLRMVVFVIFWVVGFDFWIFPNFFDEYAGILDSFLPFYTFERRLDDLQALVVRLVVGVMLGCAIQQISLEHSFDDFYDFGKMAVLDFVQWGEDHLIALPAAQTVPSLTQLQDELKELDADDGDENETLDDGDLPAAKSEDAGESDDAETSDAIDTAEATEADESSD
jgi:translocation protein SEC62